MKSITLKSGLVIHVGTSWKDVQQFAAPWKDLHTKHGLQFFQSFEWNSVWIETFGETVSPRILFVLRDHRLQAIIPLKLSPICTSDTVPGKLSFLTSPDADRETILSTSPDIASDALAEYCLIEKHLWNTLDLFPFEDQALHNDLVTKLRQSGTPLISNRHGELALDVAERDATESNAVTRTMDSSLRRKLARLSKSGKVDLRFLETPEDIRKVLPFFFQSHIQRWKGTESPSKLCSSSYRLFYTALADQLSNSGHVKVITLDSGSLAVAYYFAFFSSSEVALYTPTYEVYYKRDSPGRLLLHVASAELRRRGYCTINHLYGAETYKREFCNKYLSTFRIIAFSRSSSAVRFRINQSLISTLGRTHGFLSKLSPKLTTKLRVWIITEGYLATCEHLLRKCLSKVFYYRTLLVFKYDRNGRNVTGSLSKGMSIQELFPENMPKIAHIHGFAMGDDKHKVALERFNAGARCFVIDDRGYVASICWAVFDQDYLYDVECHYKLEKGQVMLVDAVTPETYRGQGLYPILLGYLASLFAEMGFTVLGNCLPGNVSSLKGIAKVGFQHTETIRLVKCFGRKLRRR